MKHLKPVESGDWKKHAMAAAQAAHAAGNLIRQNLFSAKKIKVETSHDIKLELDVRCQKLIEQTLGRAFPRIAFLGEEGASGAADADCRWVVDPIDGTVNFAHGIPHASVSIALQVQHSESKVQSPKSKVQSLKSKVQGPKSKVQSGNALDASDLTFHVSRPTFHASGFAPYATVVGVVYDPFTDELWTATRGQAARLNGRPIHVSRIPRLAQAIASIGFAKSRSSVDRALPYFIWLARRVRKIRMMGSAALALAYVATGRFDAYIERGISIWDIAAGGLILECAGGRFWHEPIAGAHKLRMIASNGLLHRYLPIPV